MISTLGVTIICILVIFSASLLLLCRCHARQASVVWSSAAMIHTALESAASKSSALLVWRRPGVGGVRSLVWCTVDRGCAWRAGSLGRSMVTAHREMSVWAKHLCQVKFLWYFLILYINYIQLPFLERPCSFRYSLEWPILFNVN